MKKVTKKIIILVALIIVTSSMMIGCEKAEGERSKGNRKGKTIAGKWEQMDGAQTIEFFKEGTVIVVNEGDPPLTGDYRLIDDSRIRMDFKGLGELFGAVVAETSVLRNEITLVSPTTGKIEVYRRLKSSKTEEEKLPSRQKEEEHKLSKKEIRLLGKYVGQPEKGSQLFLELKRDGTALISSSSILGWELIWEPKDNSRYSPTLTLLLYASNGSVTYHVGDMKKTIKVSDDFDSFRVDYWHGLRKEVLLRGQEANLIKLNKVKVWDTNKRTICPGEVEIWDRYINREDQKIVLELKRIPNFTPPGWKRLTGCDGLCLFYSTIEWEFNGNGIQVDIGDEKSIELEIKGNTLLDKRNSITFVKQNDDFFFSMFSTKPRELENLSDPPEIELEQETKLKSTYDIWEENKKKFLAEPVTKPVTKLNFKKLSAKDEIQAQQLWKRIVQQKTGRLPAILYKRTADTCREIIQRWPESEYAFKAKRVFRDLPERYQKQHNITDG